LPDLGRLEFCQERRLFQASADEIWRRVCVPDYVQLGIQQFASPNLYQIHVAKESTEKKSLRLARYFRFHLEKDNFQFRNF
jgi:hypothetical protein